MKLRTHITERTRYADIEASEKYYSEAAKAQLTEAAEKRYGTMLGMSFSTFWACCNGDTSHLGDMTHPTVLQVYWLRRFKTFVDEYTQQLNRLQPPELPEATQAAQGTLQVTFGEATLVFLQQHFGLHSYKEAEQITLGELLIAKRTAYNAEIFRRNMAAIQRRKLKTHGNHH